MVFADILAFDSQTDQWGVSQVQVQLLAVADGFAMVRQDGAMPFVVGIKRLHRASRQLLQFRVLPPSDTASNVDAEKFA